MTLHVRKYWDFMRSSFWFLPSLMSAAAVLLAVAVVALDNLRVLRRHAEMIATASRKSIPADDDRLAVEERFQAVIRTLEKSPS